MNRRGYLLGFFIPHSVAVILEDSRRRRRQEARAAFERASPPARPASGFDYEAALRFLVEERGLNEEQVRLGSMPEELLGSCVEAMSAALAPDRPLAILQVGNFVGLSVAFLSAFARGWHEDSVVVSIDPAISHRGVERPDDDVIALLNRFGLQDANVIVRGFSLARNMGDDFGYVLSDDVANHARGDPFRRFQRADSGERALPNLARIAPGRFDVVLIDGNHEGDYVRAEIAEVDRLLAPGGQLVIDDVDWGALQPAVRALTESGSRFSAVRRTGRVGVWRKAAA